MKAGIALAAASLCAAGCAVPDGLDDGAAEVSEDRTELLAPGDEEAADWAQFGRSPRHTSYNPREDEVTPDTVTFLQPVWTCCDAGTRMDVAVWRDQVFVTNADPYTQFPSPEPFALVSARDAETGDELWAAPTGQGGELANVVSAPAVGYGRVFAQDENRFFAVSTKNGRFVAAPHGFPAMDYAASNPVAARRAVYFEATEDIGEGRILHAFAEDGTPRWSVAIAGGVREPAIANERIWTVAGDHLLALALASGNPVCESPAVEGVLGSPSVSGGRVLAVTASGRLHAFAERTGAPLWSAALGGDPGAVPAPPAADERSVYAAVDEGGGGIAVLALDAATGAQRFRTVVGTSRRSGLIAVAGGLVYAPAADGRLFAIDAVTGRLLATFRFDGPVRTPAVAGGRVYVPTDRAGVTALGLSGI